MNEYGLITIHNAINHGAVLQALATQQAFSKYECSVDVINYVPKYIREDNLLVRKNRGAAIRILDIISHRKKKVSKFSRFVKTNLRLTEEFYSSDEIAMQTEKYDGFIAGSDQIWNPNITGGIVDKAYFCDFAKEGQNVISYASSLGDKLCFDKETELIFKSQLGRYSHISVREKSGVDFLKERLDIVAEQVIDPTLLLSQEEWDVATKQSSLSISKPYIFVYSVGRTKELIQYAKTVQKTLGMEIIVSNSIMKYPFRKVKYMTDDSPEDFLYLIKNAAVVITSSYHGTIFSANFNVPFLSFPASNVTTNRSSELLDLIGLQKQFIFYDTPFSESMLDINWNMANDKIGELRNESYKYIEKCIRGNNG